MPLSHLLPVIQCRITVAYLHHGLIPWSQLRISSHVNTTALLPRRAVDGGPSTQSLNNRPLLRLSLTKLASSTSPQKPPTTYMWVNDFGPHTDSIFMGATYTRVYTVMSCVMMWLGLECCVLISLFIWPPSTRHSQLYLDHQSDSQRLAVEVSQSTRC